MHALAMFVGVVVVSTVAAGALLVVLITVPLSLAIIRWDSSRHANYDRVQDHRMVNISPTVTHSVGVLPEEMDCGESGGEEVDGFAA